MRRSLLALILSLVACTKAREATPTSGSDVVTPTVAAKPVKDGIVIPANHPTTGLMITNHCSLSPHPPSTFFWSTVSVYDLDAATWTSQHTEGDDGPPGPPPRPGESDPDAPKVTSSHGALAADKVASLRALLAAVLAGGPYRPVYPPSGGSRCTLILGAQGGEPFFSIDRAEQIDDAVARLMAAL